MFNIFRYNNNIRVIFLLNHREKLILNFTKCLCTLSVFINQMVFIKYAI